MNKTIQNILVVIAIMFILPTGAHAYVRSTPFLGIGLGWNIYNKADVSELGPAWVYNWTLPPATGNNPYTDFGSQFVPMVWGCGGNVSVQNWITTNSYSGPVLFLNEPDNGTEGGGSNCSPSNAVLQLESFITWKKAYELQTSRTIDIIFGGTYFGPDMNWARNASGRIWIEEFYVQWKARNVVDPDIAGVHLHMYPWYPDVDASQPLPSWLSKESLLAHMKRRWTGGRDPLYNQDFIGWKQWLNDPVNKWALGTKSEIWITEMGILHDRVPKTSADYVLKEIIPYFESEPMMKRVAWFAHAVRTDWPWFDQTALMDLNNVNRTSTWTVFKDLCLTAEYCVPANLPPFTPTPTIDPSSTPIQTPTPTVTLGPSPTPTRLPTVTKTPTPSKTPTPTKTPTKTPSPTRTPSPSKTPTVTKTPTPSPTQINTPTPGPSGSILSLQPLEDAFVKRSSASSNYGSVNELRVDATSSGPSLISYMKFDTSSFKGRTVLSAVLKMRVTDSSKHLQTIYYSPNAQWTEKTITYTNSRAMTMTSVATISNAKSGQTVSVNVLDAFQGLSTSNSMTFIISTLQTDNMEVYSREGTVAPVLEIIYD